MLPPHVLDALPRDDSRRFFVLTVDHIYDIFGVEPAAVSLVRSLLTPRLIPLLPGWSPLLAVYLDWNDVPSLGPSLQLREVLEHSRALWL